MKLGCQRFCWHDFLKLNVHYETAEHIDELQKSSLDAVRIELNVHLHIPTRRIFDS